MKFDCGGLEFTGCPFSGWYMNTERYNLHVLEVQRLTHKCQ